MNGPIENKEWICAGCAIEIEPNKQSKCPNVFTGLTKKGKSLKDFLTSIIKENLDESMIGHKLCTSCYDALNHIEVELVSKELNHLVAILHFYAGDLIFMK